MGSSYQMWSLMPGLWSRPRRGVCLTAGAGSGVTVFSRRAVRLVQASGKAYRVLVRSRGEQITRFLCILPDEAITWQDHSHSRLPSALRSRLCSKVCYVNTRRPRPSPCASASSWLPPRVCATSPLAHDLGCTPKTVIKWRARWAAAEPQLAAVEHTAADLKRLIARVLADAPRPGAPDTFTAEQIVQIINLACTAPADAGRPVDAWTRRELADEAINRQIVASISPTSVGRCLKAGRSSAASQPVLAQRQNQGRGT